ncbi:hypothetical protein [Xenorhabdus innexi]|uniref:Uncharacterized protein n=2 Tax=Xenorhabdus innexi TaxID=290109 RepID=A0A1N6MXS7_9GAMM|nr:hypothetical protein [Xenorhabdus innexi]PHM29995.1 hypothetical protein Xinn_03631 [Xenorhabdus innexi]SIP73587.1 exported hypothetical protein [Xenorhabdus innexi]
MKTNKEKIFIVLFFIITFISTGVKAEINNIMPEVKYNQEQSDKHTSKLSSDGSVINFTNGSFTNDGIYGALDIKVIESHCLDSSVKSVHMKARDWKAEPISYNDGNDCVGEDKYVTWEIKSNDNNHACNIRLLKHYDGNAWWHNVIETGDVVESDAPHITGCNMAIKATCDGKNCFNKPVNASHIIFITVEAGEDSPSTGSDGPGGDGPEHHGWHSGVGGCDENNSLECYSCPPHAICNR